MHCSLICLSNVVEPAMLAFKSVVFKVGIISSCVKHEEADKLLVSSINMNETRGERQIISGIAQYYSTSEIINKKVIVVSNIKPLTLRGKETQGMLLCGFNQDNTKVEIIEAHADSIIGERVTIDSMNMEQEAEESNVILNLKKKNSPWNIIVERLRVNDQGVLMFAQHLLTTKISKLPLRTASLTNVKVS